MICLKGLVVVLFGVQFSSHFQGGSLLLHSKILLSINFDLSAVHMRQHGGPTLVSTALKVQGSRHGSFCFSLHPPFVYQIVHGYPAYSWGSSATRKGSACPTLPFRGSA